MSFSLRPFSHNGPLCPSPALGRWRTPTMAVMITAITAIAGFMPSRYALAGLLTGQEVQVQGTTRSYDLYVPDDLGRQAVPLVFMFHGHRGSSKVMTGENHRAAPYKLWLALAQRDKFIVVAPQGEKGSDGYRGWNDCRADAKTNPAVDDVAFVDAMLAAISAQYAVDKKRIYTTGTSNGGNFSYRLAQERTRVFAAAAPVVAAMPAVNKCQPPTAPISLLIMNGTADPILPFAGGAVGRRKSDQEARGSTLSAQETVQYWTLHNGTDSKAVITELPDIDADEDSSIRVTSYGHGREGSEVVLYEVRGGGHTEPSLSQHYGWLYRRIVGPQNHDIEMAEEVWRFFQRHHR